MDMSGSMKAQSGDCSFAGTLTLAMIFFVALGWLIRIRRTRFVLPDLWLGNLPRYTSRDSTTGTLVPIVDV